MFVDQNNLSLIGRDVDHLDWSGLVGHWNWESIIDENTEDNTIFEAYKERLLFGRT